MQTRARFDRRFFLILVASVLLAACKPQAPSEDASSPSTAQAPAPASAPTSASTDAMPARLPFDAQAFAGTFTGTLPCADCPGIDTRLALAPDGTYTITETYRERSVAPLTGNGTWTVEDNDARLRLDPNRKQDNDRLFAILSNDEIRQLDLEGKPIDSHLPYSLKRAQ